MLESLLGVRLTLWLGPSIAVPAPAPIVEALSSVEVSLSDEGRDGFQLTFSLGRGKTDLVDYPLLSSTLLRPFNRVIVQVWIGVIPEVLIDGFITNYHINSSDQPGNSTLTVTSEDVRVMMDLHEVSMAYPQMTPDMRVNLILLKYLLYLAMAPVVVPVKVPLVPLLFEQIPVQNGTDLKYMLKLAKEAGYVFYVEPTPVPMVNIAYWGPKVLTPLQRAISINAGPNSNVDTLNFHYDGLEPKTVLGNVQSKRTGLPQPVVTVVSTRPPTSPLPALLVQQPNVRSVQAHHSAGLDLPAALEKAQAITDDSTDVLKVEGELDAMRYGGVLRPRRMVGVRGAGFLHDGYYYVKSVTHKIKRGEYKQNFSLRREGLGAIAPVIVP